MKRIVLILILLLQNISFAQHTLSLCALFHNEATHLKEWIEYHRLIGVDHFYLYNTGSTDDYKTILKPYVRDGIVTLIEWPQMGHEQDEPALAWHLGTQISAYENAVKFKALGRTEWLALLGVDEFLTCATGNSLPKLLKKYARYSGIHLSSDNLNAYSVDQGLQKKLVIETNLLTKAPDEPSYQKLEKTIFKPKEIKGFTWPLYKCVYQSGAQAKTIGKDECKIHRYLHRFKGHLQNHPSKDKLIITCAEYSDEEIQDLLENDYEIEIEPLNLQRFVSKILNRLD